MNRGISQSRHGPESGRGLAVSLGWLSIGLGAAQLLAARPMTRALDLSGQENMARLCGLRELASGVGILSSRDPAPWIWGRVAGDVLDLAVLAAPAARNRSAAWALVAVAGVTALDLACIRMLRQRPQRLEVRRDYSQRRGLSGPPEELRGSARELMTPRHLRQHPMHH